MKNIKIVIASGNSGKIIEIKKILQAVKEIKIEVLSLQDYGFIEEPDEPYNSFMENAIHKAKYYAEITKEATLSEDSGLTIEALDGFPGVKTKDLIVECNGMPNTFLKLESLLSHTTDRRAYFNSAAALYFPTDDLLVQHEARDPGIICFPPRGEDGFAFDPIFIPEGYDKTFAELGVEQKNKISHRARSMKGVVAKLQAFLINTV
jgi:XTP/dITP diphosphohydrolase